ncbi:hypothetical protein B0H14DRAFT_2634264 [Mycena olivaceomarginata]|nr:hypothetical protein B0H14DRAFT_2634264 [Mycena olivaceomarginata]
MTGSDLTVANATSELRKAEKALDNHAKKKSEARKKPAATLAKKNLEARIAECRRILGQSIMDLTARTMQGSPNDPIPPAEGPVPIPPSSSPKYIFLLIDHLNNAQSTPGLMRLLPCRKLESALIPRSGWGVGCEHYTWTAESTQFIAVRGKHSGRDVPIDPALRNESSDMPPAKRAHGATHRKISLSCSPVSSQYIEPKFTVEVDPMDLVTPAITSCMTTKFTKMWDHHVRAIRAAEPSSNAEELEGLFEAATDIMDAVGLVAAQANLSSEQLKWGVEHTAGGLVQISDVIALRDWLIASDFMPAPLATAATKKASASNDDDAPAVEIMIGGKRQIMTPTMITTARKDPKAYPGCVEAGMDTVAAILKNRAGREKCVSCEDLRGKALDKPNPPLTDGPFLTACKCPLRGAALELWMIKVTAKMEGIPQRGADDIKNSRLALNPDTLKLIAGAIQVASGHEVDTLLRPEYERLELTVHWALKQLTMHADVEDADDIAASLRQHMTMFKSLSFMRKFSPCSCG